MTDLERCEMEIQSIRNRIEDHPLWLTALGDADWCAEAELIRKTGDLVNDPIQQYHQLIDRKTQYGSNTGFKPTFLPSYLFNFQGYLTEWGIERGRGAYFGDCGLGKTILELVWSQNVVEHTNRHVLILTPLAVAKQTLREAEKFGIQAVIGSANLPATASIVVINYEKLHQFNCDDFAGVVCDESSLLKNYDGVRKAQITDFMRKMPYRLLGTATAAPNDFTELGTSSEALGELGHIDLLNRFFKNDQNTSDTRLLRRAAISQGGPRTAGWRFKGHAEDSFWRYVASWARAFRKPSDLGPFSDEKFVLPELIEKEHVIETKTLADGMLFAMPATNIREERAERRRTIQERCEYAAKLARSSDGASVTWCHLNDEADLLEEMIPGARQVSAATTDDERIEIYEDFANGNLQDLIIKPKIGAWGLNWQHCNHVITFASHSYEQYYQAVRRCWRFGQKRDVTVDLIATEGEIGAKENLQRKSIAADRMFTTLVAAMNHSIRIGRTNKSNSDIQLPSWL